MTFAEAANVGMAAHRRLVPSRASEKDALLPVVRTTRASPQRRHLVGARHDASFRGRGHHGCLHAPRIGHMKRMRFSARGFSPAIAKLAFSSVMALALSSMLSPKAMAGAVYRCDGCTSSEKMEVARSGPLGFTYVVDTAAAELTLWSVEYDGESRRKKANESRVDSVTYNRFRFFLERPSAAPGRSAAGTSASAQAGRGAAEVNHSVTR